MVTCVFWLIGVYEQKLGRMSNAIVHAYRHKFYLRPILLHYLEETATLQFIIRVVDKIQVLLRNKLRLPEKDKNKVSASSGFHRAA